MLQQVANGIEQNCNVASILLTVASAAQAAALEGVDTLEADADTFAAGDHGPFDR